MRALRYLCWPLVFVVLQPATWLQPLAWIGMVTMYAREDGLRQGVQKTLDGQHPCAMCRAISETRQEEKSNPKGDAITPKKEVLATWKSPAAPRMPAGHLLPESTDEAPFGKRVEGPRLPPPRSV